MLLVSGESDVETIRREVKAKFGRNVQKATIAADIVELHAGAKSWAKRLAEGDQLLRAKLYDDLTIKCIAILYDAMNHLSGPDSGRNAYKLSQLWPQLQGAMQFNLDLAEKYPLYLHGAELAKRANANPTLEGAPQ